MSTANPCKKQQDCFVGSPAGFMGSIHYFGVYSQHSREPSMPLRDRAKYRVFPA